MALISSSEKSKHFTNKEHLVYPIKGTHRHNHKDTSADAKQLDNNGDNLDLSKTAQAVLVSIEEKFSNLLNDNLHYKQQFLGNTNIEKSTPVKRGLYYLSRNKTFLADPFVKQLSLTDESFGSFYNKLETLGDESQKIYASIQKNIKSHPMTYTYRGN